VSEPVICIEFTKRSNRGHALSCRASLSVQYSRVGTGAVRFLQRTSARGRGHRFEKAANIIPSAAFAPIAPGYA
jgi:hypothetical protein